MSTAAPHTPTAVLETALYAEDLEAAVAFYGDLIGLELHQRVENRHAFFRIGPAMLLLFNPAETVKPGTNPRLPVPPHGATGPGHVCFAMQRNAIAALKNRLLSAGIKIEAEFDWPTGARSVYFRDPAGNSVELAEPQLWKSSNN